MSERNRPNKTERVVRELTRLVLGGHGAGTRAIELAKQLDERGRLKVSPPKDDR